MRLYELFKGISIKKSNVKLESDVAYITNDHRKVKENFMFVALKGTKRSGVDFITSALEMGASVIVTEDSTVCDKIPFILVENIRSVIAKLWSNFYQNPSEGISTVAITGTNGKTSSSYFLYSILRSSGISCGLISTIECLVNGKRIKHFNEGSVSDISSAMTTPDPEKLYFIYNEMKKAKVKIVIIEASSHALEQNRLDGIKIKIGAFTNLTPEHLDYHKSLDDYSRAKEKLMYMSEICLVNIDDRFGSFLAEKYSKKTFTFSVENHFADFFASECKKNLNGSRYMLSHKEEKISIFTNAIGTFNIYNSMLAASCAKLLGIEDEKIRIGINQVTQIKGRIERYKNKNIYIDYAHTPDAMKKVLELFKELEPDKKLIVLFGCGGERDKSKRSEMGQISTKFADYTIITSDNSRGEEVDEIISNILEGVLPNKEYIVIPNRKDAIKFVAKNLKFNEILLLLGKGHEEYEITKEGKRHFNEREVLDEVFGV